MERLFSAMGASGRSPDDLGGWVLAQGSSWAPASPSLSQEKVDVGGGAGRACCRVSGACDSALCFLFCFFFSGKWETRS